MPLYPLPMLLIVWLVIRVISIIVLATLSSRPGAIHGQMELYAVISPFVTGIMAAFAYGFLPAFFVFFVLDVLLQVFPQSWIKKAIIATNLDSAAKWLATGSDEEKMQAAFVLGSVPNDRRAVALLPETVTALHSGNAEVRYQMACAVRKVCGTAMNAFGPSSVRQTIVLPPQLEQTLIELMADPEVKVRAPAAVSLVDCGRARLPDVLPAMVSSLQSKDKSVWGIVTWYLDCPGRYVHTVIPEIFEAVQQNPGMAKGGLSLVFRWIDPQAKPLLEEGTGSENLGIQQLSAKGLEGIAKGMYSRQ